MKTPFLLVLLLFVFVQSPGVMSDSERGSGTPMNNERLDKLIKSIDSDVEGRPGYWSLKHEGFQAQIITDEKADRMRVLVAISSTAKLDGERLYRVMQANFGSALDSRQRLAKDILWAACIHPLSELSDEELISGLTQTINLAATHGSTFSSGALVFQGGDSHGLKDKYYWDIMEKAKKRKTI